MYSADQCKEKDCKRKKEFENFPEDSPFVGKFCIGKISNGKEEVCCMKVIEWNFSDYVKTSFDKIKKKTKKKKTNG